MGTFFSSLPLSFLLRDMFAGVFFVISYYVVAHGGPKQFIHSGNIFPVALPVALVAGVTVYALHRALIFPFWEWFFNSQRAKNWRSGKHGKNGNYKLKLTLISINTMERLKTRCDQRAKNTGHRDPERAKYMDAWADYIHLQYTSSMCIIAGYVTGLIVGDSHCMIHRGMGSLIIAALALYVAALTSNWRSHSVDEFFEKHNHCTETIPTKGIATPSVSG